MPRRAIGAKRKTPPDGKYANTTVGVFINKTMLRGQKATAERIVYGALDIVGERTKKDPLEVFLHAMKNATPMVEVKPRRVGGATYQVPIEVRPERGATLAMKWILGATRSRSGKSTKQKLAEELIDASQGQGASIKKREDTHKMADANKAFVHYRR
ncbi:MAG: 30S ribosomal protein S7 [Dehalococcoidia bacterium]|nr:30S ribosomal protein S7 [Dehalococcoidia bacterium]